MRSRNIKKRLIGELVIIGILTALFLAIFPKRNILIDIALALFALTAIGLDARFTRIAVWTQLPSLVPERERLKRCLAVLIPVTALLMLMCLGVGSAIGYRENGLQGVLARIGRWQIILAVGFYLPWALLQQTLFQFYLFGRLLVLVPAWLAILCTAAAYGAVHLPDPFLSAFAGLAGVFWSFMYYRYRRLVPLAFSHACLGAAFHYWIYNIDLAREWTALFG